MNTTVIKEIRLKKMTHCVGVFVARHHVMHAERDIVLAIRRCYYTDVHGLLLLHVIPHNPTRGSPAT